MGMIRFLTIVFVAVVAMSAAHAQNVNLLGLLDENVYPSARSSGAAIVGAQVLSDTQKIEGDGADILEFSFFLPPKWSTNLVCVNTEAADGLYDGRGTFSISAVPDAQSDATGMRSARYPTAHPDRLDGLGHRELAIAVRPGACDRAPFDEGMTEDTALELTLALWQPSSGEENDLGEVSLLINPFDAQKVRIRANGRTFPCSPVDVPVPASYSMVCPITLSALGKSPALVQLQKLVPGMAPESSFIKLHYPSP